MSILGRGTAQHGTTPTVVVVVDGQEVFHRQTISRPTRGPTQSVGFIDSCLYIYNIIAVNNLLMTYHGMFQRRCVEIGLCMVGELECIGIPKLSANRRHESVLIPPDEGCNIPHNIGLMKYGIIIIILNRQNFG